MSHLARQEIYFDRQFGLDETLEGVERVTTARRAAGGARSVLGRLAGGHGARRRNGLEIPRERCRLADLTARARLTR